MFPYDHKDAQALYQDRLREADEWRRAHTGRDGRPGLWARIRERLGARLGGWRRPVEPEAQPAPQFD